MEVDIIIIWLLQITMIVQADVCQKLSPCKCKTADGVVDLTALPSSAVVTDANYSYTLSLCTGVTCAEKNGVSVCQTDRKKTVNSYVNGYIRTATFSGDPEKNQLVLSYTGATASTSALRNSTILLICDEDASNDVFSLLKVTPQGQVSYSFKLVSKHACIIKKQLSAGSVLLILFFVFVLVYLIGGILFLRFYRGASGKEMIPNFEFWKDFPFLVKDGMTFTFRGCKTDTTYTQI
ncbi:cation-dependent mannose-6-phosphate receptor-like [Saccostrea cucullata]|uniref:cation-dependent mannose-6-phosphate receptor-like n=1 Tax=Saccostrea cuccullata TaxID=36930 RepID=UPI002ED5E386